MQNQKIRILPKNAGNYLSHFLLQGGISRSSLFLYVCTGFRESWNLFSNIIFHSISPLVSLVSHLEPRNLVCCCVFKLVSQLVCNCVSDRLFPLLVPCVSPTACRTVLAWFPNLSPTIISTLSLTLSVISFPCWMLRVTKCDSNMEVTREPWVWNFHCCWIAKLDLM